MREQNWQSRVWALRADAVVELAQRLDLDILNGWLLVEGVADYNIDSQELVDLLEAAMSQHENEDFDEYIEGSRRKADLALLEDYLDAIEAGQKKVEADFAAGAYWWI